MNKSTPKTQSCECWCPNCLMALHGPHCRPSEPPKKEEEIERVSIYSPIYSPPQPSPSLTEANEQKCIGKTSSNLSIEEAREAKEMLKTWKKHFVQGVKNRIKPPAGFIDQCIWMFDEVLKANSLLSYERGGEEQRKEGREERIKELDEAWDFGYRKGREEQRKIDSNIAYKFMRDLAEEECKDYGSDVLKGIILNNNQNHE